ncbi:MAG: PIN domain-containing protein [Thaumarchaeota archaeon]|nr:PIN domain-containing protein [Nitrososphaerota archaeon]
MVAQISAALDTNIFISVINKERDYANSKKILDLVDDGKLKGIVSTIVVAEISSGYEDSKEKDEFLASILGASNYEIVDVTVPIALDAGNLRLKKHLNLPDALIVASALRHGAEFLISNDNSIAKTQKADLRVLTASEFVKFFERREESRTKK